MADQNARAGFAQIHGGARLFAKNVKTDRGAFTAYNVSLSKWIQTDSDGGGEYLKAYIDCRLSNEAKQALAGAKQAAADPEKTFAYYDVIIDGWLEPKAARPFNTVRLFINHVEPADFNQK